MMRMQRRRESIGDIGVMSGSMRRVARIAGKRSNEINDNMPNQNLREINRSESTILIASEVGLCE